MKFDQLISYFSQCHDGYWVFSHENRLIFANGASHTLTGWSPEKFANIHWREFNDALQKICAENHKDLFDWESPPDQPSFDSFQLLTPKPRMICRYVQKIALNNQSIDQAKNEEVIYVMTFRDLTKEMNLEVAKSNFLSNAAHELRTPMSSVLGFTELLLNNPYSQERTLRTLGIIHKQAKRTVDLINELLDLSRIESQKGMEFELNVYNLRKQIMAVIGGLHPSQSQRVVVTGEHNSNLNVDIDEAKFQMAFLNILSNALKYSPTNDSVHVRTHHQIMANQAWVGVEVEDKGVGIQADDLPKLFTRFFRADPTSNISGTGLGLHLVKEIMEQMGGRVEIQSQYGEGTRAYLWLPESKLGKT